MHNLFKEYFGGGLLAVQDSKVWNPFFMIWIAYLMGNKVELADAKNTRERYNAHVKDKLKVPDLQMSDFEFSYYHEVLMYCRAGPRPLTEE